jgi:hypothetical protein
MALISSIVAWRRRCRWRRQPHRAGDGAERKVGRSLLRDLLTGDGLDLLDSRLAASLPAVRLFRHIVTPYY